MKPVAVSPKSPEHVLKCKLAAQVLSSFGTLRLGVTGFSMLPTIWPGDVLSIERCDSTQVFPGDIVFVEREDQFIVHRIVRKLADAEGSQLITQGDGMLAPDAPVSATEILGKVQYILRNGTRLDVPAHTSFLGRCIMNLVQRSTLAARGLVYLHSFHSHHNSRRREAFCQN